MAVYVMSDIHGESELFHSMLQKICFKNDDILYILGDVIDRGQCGIKLLQEIMRTSNIKMILGNHEYMMLQYFGPDATEADVRRWSRNGNGPTVSAFEALSVNLQSEILLYLNKLPKHRIITVGEKKYYLVHGFPGENVHDEVWVRPDIHSKNPIDGTSLIIGHTPVISMVCSKEERTDYLNDMISRGEHPKILHTDSFIDIDCGCSYDEPLKTLGCLRIDDMKEFYVNRSLV